MSLNNNTTSLFVITPNSTRSIPNPDGCLVLQFNEFVPWDNPDNVFSFRVEDVFRRLKGVLFLPVLFLIGGPANLINMAVFYKQGLNARINVCLFALSLADGLYLSSNMLFYGEQLYFEFTTREMYGPVMRFVTNNNLLGIIGCTWVSQIVTAIIAMERCFCILRPLQSQAVLSASTTAVVIGVVSVLVVGGYYIVVSRYRIICAYDPGSGSTLLTVVGGAFYFRHQKLIDIMDVFLYGVGIPVAMIVVVIAMTIVTTIKLRQAAAWRAGVASSTSSSSSSSGVRGVSAQEVAITKMLVCNSFFFIVCVLPIAIFRVVLLFIPELNAGRRHHNLFMTSLWIVDIISYVNATFNIVVYFSTGSRYRKTLRELFTRKGAHNSQASDTVSKTTASTVL